MAGTIKVDTLQSDSNLALKIATANVAFIDATGINVVGGNLSVGGTQFASGGQIQTAGIADGAVTNDKIVSVANTKISGNIVSSQIAANAVTQTAIASGVGGTGPAFSATIGTNQSLSAGTETKLNFNTEQFDTNSNYDTGTYRFTPTVEGYYQINAAQEYSNATGIQAITIKKNGARVSSGGSRNATPAGTFFSSCSVIVYLNGSTDYVEAFGFTDAATTAFSGSSSTFTGCLVRAA